MSRTRHPLKAYLSTDGTRPTSACCDDCVTGAASWARQELRAILSETEAQDTPYTGHLFIECLGPQERDALAEAIGDWLTDTRSYVTECAVPTCKTGRPLRIHLRPGGRQ